MIFLTNAFSINMLPEKIICEAEVRFRPIHNGKAHELLASGFVSAIGHTDTATILGNLLRIDVPVNRISVQMIWGKPYETQLIVAQYNGPRLPEGSTTLPEGATFTFWEVMLTSENVG